jgi:integrase
MSKVPLTDKFLERIRPASRRLEIADARAPGLLLIVQPSGHASFAVRYRHRGRTRKHTIGSYPTVSLRAARVLASDALRAVAEGKDPAAEKKRRSEQNDLFPNLVRSFIERYAKPRALAKSRPDLWLETARILGMRPDRDNPTALIEAGGDVLPRWRGHKVHEISRRDVIELLDTICDRGAPVMANRTLAAIRKFFNWCVERDVLQSSPCAGVRAPAVEKARDRVLSDAELSLIWRASVHLGYPWGPLVHLLMLTGQRANEIARLRWTEVDTREKSLALSAERVKNAQAHEVPLAEVAHNLFADLPRITNDHGLVFVSGAGVAVSSFSRAKAQLDAEIAALSGEDLAPWTFHDLRRSMASGLARLGVELHVIEKILNHKSGTFRGVVGVYQRHDFASEKRRAMDLWGIHLLKVSATEIKSAARAPKGFGLFDLDDDTLPPEQRCKAIADRLRREPISDEDRHELAYLVDPTSDSEWLLTLSRRKAGRPPASTTKQLLMKDELGDFMYRLRYEDKLLLKQTIHMAKEKYGVSRTECMAALSVAKAYRAATKSR